MLVLSVAHMVAAVAGILFIVIVLWDAFETVVLPRRVSRRLRLARVYFRSTWRACTSIAERVSEGTRRESVLAAYGPLAILALLALWVLLLIIGYALLLWGLGSPIAVARGVPDFGTDLYFSGTTFLTLGLGDIFPRDGPARLVTVVEVGSGFGILALVIGYLPVLYQAFSRRELRISLLDAHACSPPTAGSLLLRHPPARRARRLTALLAEWEGWAAELLETHLSYPVLAYYRSQHENQSWVAALAVILDTCALVLACGHGRLEEEQLSEQAAFTFAIARHAAIDLSQVFWSPRATRSATEKRLPAAERARLRDILATVGESKPSDSVGDEVEDWLDMLRALYEPYLQGLAEFLVMPLPPWVSEPGALDDWQTTADGLTSPSLSDLARHQQSDA